MAAYRRVTLASSVVGAVIVALDGTVLTVAQPTLQRDLHASFARVQWTSTGYLIAVAGLLVFAGRLGDRHGHQRLFGLGVLGFGAVSAGIALAPGIGWVIALRVAQGVFGALLQPATLGMLRAAYPPDRLGMPIALRTSAIGLAAASGPLLGGALVSAFGWRAVFTLNVLPALVLGSLALTVRPPADAKAERTGGADGTGRADGMDVTVGADGMDGTGGAGRAGGPRVRNADPEMAAVTAHRAASRTRLTASPDLDVPGACLLAAALVALVHTLVAIPDSGWTGTTALGLAVVTVAGAAFVRRERRAANPLVPIGVLGSAAVGAALGILVAASAAMFGTLFTVSYVLQHTLGLDPLETGVRALPAGVTMVLGAPLAAALLRRAGARATTVTGTLLLTTGVLLLARLDTASDAVTVGAGFLLLGGGFATVMVTATAVVVRRAPTGSAGVAGGLQQTAMNIGPVLGIAVAATLLTASPGSAFLPLVTAAAICTAGTLLALRLPGHKNTVSTARRSPDDTASVRTGR
ncbi:MFS transporter [Streptomyces sp. NPDC007084]|uniref:MFS transporter n=1 Tax=Streptomyces sp. NPDC007084 TaxID=3154313 RepID=UPI003456E6FE